MEETLSEFPLGTFGDAGGVSGDGLDGFFTDDDLVGFEKHSAWREFIPFGVDEGSGAP